jgi:hypothetical protein
MKCLSLAVFFILIFTQGVAAETFNFDSSHFPHFRKCLSEARLGKNRCRMLIVGDSTSAVDNIGGPNAKYYAWPAQMGRLLAPKIGLPVDYDALMGNSNMPNNVETDARITSYSGAWYSNHYQQSIGGDWFSNYSSKASGVFSFAPLSQADSFKFWYITSPHSGLIGVTIDQDVVASINTNNFFNDLDSQAFTTTLGHHTLSLTNLSDDNSAVHVIGIEAWDSKHPGISIINAAWSGSDALMWTKAPLGVEEWEPAMMINKIAPDITLIDLDVNDGARQNDLQDYRKNMQTIIKQAQSVGDVVLITSHHGTDKYADRNVKPYIDVIYSIAGKNIPVIDNWKYEVSYQNQLKNRWMYDAVHMNRLGYANFSVPIANALGGF